MSCARDETVSDGEEEGFFSAHESNIARTHLQGSLVRLLFVGELGEQIRVCLFVQPEDHLLQTRRVCDVSTPPCPSRIVSAVVFTFTPCETSVIV